MGFELIYWVPFVRGRRDVWRSARAPVRRVTRRHGFLAEASRLVYTDAFEFFSPDEFRAGTEEAKKQRRVGSFDGELVRRVSAAHGFRRVDLLHPGMMYRLFMPFWKGLATMARVEKYASYARIDPVDDPVRRELPHDYVAARFYFSDCFPDTDTNRAFVTSTIESISRQMPVVLLNTPFAVDDHRDFGSGSARVLTIGAHMPPVRNLAVQTAVIAGARASSALRGYSYLAPLRRQLARLLLGTIVQTIIPLAQRSSNGSGDRPSSRSMSQRCRLCALRCRLVSSTP